MAYRYYPNLQDVVQDQRRDRARVLVLAASALNRGWSDFEVELHDQLCAMLGTEVRVFNTSMAARTSLDSYYKYWYLRDQPFDLVILYNSINELRANNVPPELWRNDYSHYAWYDDVNFYFRHFGLTRYWSVLPFYLKHLAVRIDRKLLNCGRKVPYNSELIRPEWLEYGSTIRSAGSLRENLRRTIALARSKHEPVVVMTYAYFIPSNYSLERFKQGALGYDRAPPQGSPVEIWGRPEDVRKGLDVHNAVLREVAMQEPAIFVDQQASLGQDVTNFIDVCHLSPAGMRQFVQNLIAELRRQSFAVPRLRTPGSRR